MGTIIENLCGFPFQCISISAEQLVLIVAKVEKVVVVLSCIHNRHDDRMTTFHQVEHLDT